MICPECHIWPLAADDNFCSWCGASQLRYSAHLKLESVSRFDYPPPVPVFVTNESPTQEIVVLAVAGAESWVKAFAAAEFPARIGPGQQRSFTVDVDTFAAGTHDRAGIRIEVANAKPQVVMLRLSSERTASGATGL